MHRKHMKGEAKKALDDKLNEMFPKGKLAKFRDSQDLTERYTRTVVALAKMKEWVETDLWVAVNREERGQAIQQVHHLRQILNDALAVQAFFPLQRTEAELYSGGGCIDEA